MCMSQSGNVAPLISNSNSRTALGACSMRRCRSTLVSLTHTIGSPSLEIFFELIHRYGNDLPDKTFCPDCEFCRTSSMHGNEMGQYYEGRDPTKELGSRWRISRVIMARPKYMNGMLSTATTYLHTNCP